MKGSVHRDQREPERSSVETSKNQVSGFGRVQVVKVENVKCSRSRDLEALKQLTDG